MLKFCESKEGKRVGGGECSHLANEALRVADAEFTQVGADGKRVPDSPSDGDYVWGKPLKTYSFDANTKKAPSGAMAASKSRHCPENAATVGVDQRPLLKVDFKIVEVDALPRVK